MPDPPDRSRELAAVGASASDVLEAKHQAREVTLGTSRRSIRASSLAIRALHRGELDVAARHLAEAARLLAEAAAATVDHPDVAHAGFFADAQKELAEARLMLAVVTGAPLPSADDLGVAIAPYLNGMAEAASELRRQVLDRLRRDELAEAESLFAVMDEVYALLVTIDYPDALTGGLRRTTDALRAVVERTRGDLTHALVTARFRTALTEGTAETPLVR